MNVRPNRPVATYVSQIEQSLRASKRHGSGSLESEQARRRRLEYWCTLARDAGPEATIEGVESSFNRKYGAN